MRGCLAIIFERLEIRPKIRHDASGELSYDIKKSSGTKNILWQAIANTPDQNTWLSWNNQLGDLLRSEKRWDEATFIIENIIAHNAAYWQAYIGCGWANYDRNDGIEAAMSEIKKSKQFTAKPGKWPIC